MNKTFLVVLFVILFVGLGGLFYLKLSQKPPTTAELVANKKSLNDLVLVKNETCTFKVSDQNTGTVYGSESNFRVDFVNNDKGEITKSHMISDLTNVFLWFDDKDIGVRVAWPIVLDNSDLDVIATKFLDLGIEVESQCSPWEVDSSKFVLPDVDFKTFGTKIPGNIKEDENSPEKNAKCSACNKLDQKAATKCYQDLDC